MLSFDAALLMAELGTTEVFGRHLPGDGVNILVVSIDLRELLRCRSILENIGCSVRAQSTFDEGVRCLRDELFDLILLDQGSDKFEGLDVLAHAMDMDAGLRVVVMARSYDPGCCFKAMHSGALDYLNAPLEAIQIFALLDMFVPHRSLKRPGSHRGRKY